MFIYFLNVMSVPNLSSVGCLRARLESVKPNRETPNTQQTPGEYRANSHPALLVPGPELTNWDWKSFQRLEKG